MAIHNDPLLSDLFPRGKRLKNRIRAIQKERRLTKAVFKEPLVVSSNIKHNWKYLSEIFKGQIRKDSIYTPYQ